MSKEFFQNVTREIDDVVQGIQDYFNPQPIPEGIPTPSGIEPPPPRPENLNPIDEAEKSAEEQGSTEDPECISGNCPCNTRPFFDNVLLEHEGGLVDHPNDPGGLTNKGVILSTWQRWAPRLFGFEGTAERLRNITNDQAYEIFLVGYWTTSRAKDMKDCPMAFQYVDFYYNAPRTSVKTLQRSINTLGGSVTVDGAIGPATIAAANEIIDAGNVAKLYQTFREKRVAYYNYRADNVAGQHVFRKGWLRRANSFQDY